MKPTTIHADAQTDIVVDIGCIGWQRGNGVEDSIQTLIKRFHPRILFGFDPHPAMFDRMGDFDGALVLTKRRAAWTEDGKIDFNLNGNCSHVTLGATSDTSVRCFDLARWLGLLPETSKIVLKLDCEGAEYILLPHLIESGAIDRISRLLVEWHEGKFANGFESDRKDILDALPCPVEEWQ